MKKLKFKFKKNKLFKTYWPLLTIPIWLVFAFLLIKPNLWLKNINVPADIELPPETTPQPKADPPLAESPSPSPTPTNKPIATTTPKTNNLFKMNSIDNWDNARPTLYPFGIYAYQPLSKVEFTFEDKTSEIQPINNGETYIKSYKLKPGENIFTVRAETANGKTQTATFTVTNSNSLSDVSQDLKGKQCSESDTQHCASYSKYTRPGLCKEYKTYILCLQSKCDVNTISRDDYCE